MMRSRLLAALVCLILVAAACSDDDTPEADGTPTTGADTATAEPDDTADDGSEEDASAAATAPIELSITAVSFANGTVTVQNDGPEPVDMGNLFMCNRPNYSAIGAGVVEPGATIDVDASIVDLSADGGEVAIYTSQNFDSAGAILAYVQWGSADGGRSSVAVAAGLIADGEFVDNGGADFTVG